MIVQSPLSISLPPSFLHLQEQCHLPEYCIVLTMKRSNPWGDEQIDVLSSDEYSPGSHRQAISDEIESLLFSNNLTIDQPIKELTPEDILIKRAEMYHDYMKQIPIPAKRGSVIPFSSWMGLARSIKQLYGQPLHYLTNVLVKQWDQQRIGSEDEYQPLDMIIHPIKAEATIWLVEEVHRRTSSHHHVAKLWQSDPMYYAFIDSIFQKW